MDFDSIVFDYLKVAQKLFGPIHSEWTYNGLEFNDMGPHIRYLNDGYFVISLSERARNDNLQFHFQLSHEVCHALYPTMDRKSLKFSPATVLNEGISTYFSILATANLSDIGEMIDNLKEHNNKYYQAFILVSQLLKVDKDAIKKLREIQPMINDIRIDDFEKANLNFPQHLINELLEIF